MRRQATSLRNETMTLDAFKEAAFFKVFETDAAYMDQYGNWKKSPDKKSLVREDGSYVSTVGKRYSIVDNEKFFNTVVGTLQEAKIDFQPKQVYVDGNGKRTNMIVNLPQFKMFDGTDEVQDCELRISNSHDALLSAWTLLGWLRLVCTNGMTAFTEGFSFKMHHKGDIALKAEDAVKLYKGFDGTWRTTQDMVERMINSNGKKDAVARYIGDGENTMNNVFKGPRWAGKLQEKWYDRNETTNLWELYNMFTYIGSHEYGHNYTSKLATMDAINKEAKRWSTVLYS